MQLFFTRSDMVDAGWEISAEHDGFTTFSHCLGQDSESVRMTMRDFGEQLSMKVSDAQWWLSPMGDALRDVIASTNLRYHSVH